ncbi:hypothetical protein FEM41_05250 [Jejubacter calystegiae]|uniref:Uncharacterized protein n=1 Tax=Jejubacter calystegiae TaxID=2579935 RepID=A0A4P8YKW1_9ENTR|nr:FidL-like protein [Jejubacter calystegiae]QCT19102.1 hypothetical protein FEM41_05250 [Jejubacter calystegiae]
MKRTIALLLILMALAASFAWLSLNHGRGYYQSSCEVNLNYSDSTEGDPYHFYGNLVFDFETNRTGQLYLSGSARSADQDYIFSRYVNFSYLNENNNRYRMAINKVNKIGHDSAPDEVAQKIYRVIGLVGGVYVYMERHRDGYILLGNMVSPVMTCVILS